MATKRGNTALLEFAQASGLDRLKVGERAPLISIFVMVQGYAD